MEDARFNWGGSYTNSRNCVFLFMINFNWWGWLFGLLVTGAITFIPLDYFVFPNLRQRYYSYRLNEEEIEIQKGMFVVKRVLIPMIRVQRRND